LLPHLGRVDMALVGEPTGMQAAVGERGLVVLDGTVRGRSGHAARNEGINALYLALDDINALRRYRFPATSPTLGPIGVAVTGIQAGTQHNVVPDECCYFVDVRTTDAFTNEETVRLLQEAAPHSTLTPRSTRLRASAIADGHPLVRAARAVGAATFVSPTMSDMALIPCPSLKLGPGLSQRSHTADEYVLLDEIRQGVEGYIALLRAMAI
ncbi:MAG: peptidase dimerization domain-containing protein, partial [Bacteroidaceae bacterium]|nr:peptidase dimerization domain-containing protein [Bacteroidaceae bacterium]